MQKRDKYFNKHTVTWACEIAIVLIVISACVEQLII